MKFMSTFKELKVEEFLQEIVPDYFNQSENIEKVVKIDCSAIITDQLIQEIDKKLIEQGYKPPRYCYIHYQVLRSLFINNKDGIRSFIEKQIKEGT